MDVPASSVMRTPSGMRSRNLSPASCQWGPAWLLSAGRGVCDIVALDGTPLRTDAEASALLRGLAGF